jgi:hypothetical protein
MIREERSVFLVVLTLFVYAGIQFIEKGAILFPFPLNEVIFLFIASQFLVWNWKKHKFQLLLVLFASIFQLISTQFFWSFVIETPSMEKLVTSPTLDLFKVIYYLLILIWLYFYFTGSQIKFKFILFFTFTLFIISSLFFQNSILEMVSFVLIAAAGTFYKVTPPIHLLWILLAALQVMKISTIYIH